MVITFTGLAIGILLLNFNNQVNMNLFILVSLLLSVALIPILLTKRKPPTFKKISSISVKELYKTSPFWNSRYVCVGFSLIFTYLLWELYTWALMNFSV